MRIAYVAAAQIPSPRANSIQVMKVCQALTQNGHQVRLFVPGALPAGWEILQQQYGLITGFDVEWISNWRSLHYLDFTSKALRRARKAQAELIYTRMPQIARAAARAGIPVILELHDLPGGRFGPGQLESFLNSKAQKKVVFITRALRQLTEAQLGITLPDTDVIIAPDGVDLERYADLQAPEDARKALGWQERFTALYSGSFYQGRGMDTLFGLAKSLPEVQFAWVGGKPEEVAVWQEKVNIAGLQNVRLTGFVSNADLPRYQSAADVLLMPYSPNVAGSSGGDIARVTSPMKLFEYMACGRAILTSDLPVLHEVLNDSNAVFCPPDDLAAWKSALYSLQADEGKRQSLAKQALEDVRQYSWRSRMQRILEGWTTSPVKV